MADEKGVQLATSFELTVPSELTELYVDGVSGLVPGWPNSKVLFHSTHPKQPGSDPNSENRQGVLLMTLPTGALIELSRNILATFTAGREQVKEAAQMHFERVDAFLADLPAVAPTAQ